MPRLREELDSDRLNIDRATDYPTAVNSFSAQCSVCNRYLYIDDATKQDLDRMMANGLENPLVCRECEEDYDRLAFEQRA